MWPSFSLLPTASSSARTSRSTAGRGIRSTPSGRSASWRRCVALDLLLQQLPDPRPVVVDDRVPGRIADRVRQHHVLAEDPLEARADAEQRAAYAQVARVGLELDAHRAPRLERVT